MNKKRGTRGTATESSWGDAAVVPLPAGRGVGMERLREFLETVRDNGIAADNFLGLLHVLIGRRIARADGTVVSVGQTWRELASLLKQLRWDREVVRQLGLDPAALPPRDRQRFWYSAIAQAGVHSTRAVVAGDRLVSPLRKLGYLVGPPPGSPPDARPSRS